MQLIKPAWHLKSPLGLKNLYHTENGSAWKFTNASFSEFLTYFCHSPSSHIHSASPTTHLLQTYGKLIANPQIFPSTSSSLPPFNQICPTYSRRFFSATQNWLVAATSQDKKCPVSAVIPTQAAIPLFLSSRNLSAMITLCINNFPADSKSLSQLWDFQAQKLTPNQKLLSQDLCLSQKLESVSKALKRHTVNESFHLLYLSSTGSPTIFWFCC